MVAAIGPTLMEVSMVISFDGRSRAAGGARGSGVDGKEVYESAPQVPKG